MFMQVIDALEELLHYVSRRQLRDRLSSHSFLNPIAKIAMADKLHYDVEGVVCTHHLDQTSDLWVVSFHECINLKGLQLRVHLIAILQFVKSNALDAN